MVDPGATGRLRFASQVPCHTTHAGRCPYRLEPRRIKKRSALRFEAIDQRRRVVLDMDSTEVPVYGQQEGGAYNGHFASTCYHPLLLFTSEGDCLGLKLRPGNVASADGWAELLLPELERLQARSIEVAFRGDAAFARPELYEALEEREARYTIRLPANGNLERKIAQLLKRPVGTLYARLESYDVIAAVVDEISQTFSSDQRTARLASAMNLERRKRNRQLTVDYLCVASGSPALYIGQDMKAAHAGLGISAGEWAIAMDHVRRAISKLRAPDGDGKELPAQLSLAQTQPKQKGTPAKEYRSPEIVFWPKKPSPPIPIKLSDNILIIEHPIRKAWS